VAAGTIIMKMTPERALVLALAAVRQQIQALAVDANLAEKYGADYPAAIRASKTRAELRAALAELLKLRDQIRSPLFPW
jgi:hypothetical protein